MPKIIQKQNKILDIGSNDGVALKPFVDLGFKKVLGIEPAKNLAKLANKNKIKTFNGFLEKKILKKIKKNSDLILASNVFAHGFERSQMRRDHHQDLDMDIEQLPSKTSWSFLEEATRESWMNYTFTIPVRTKFFL